MKIICIFFLSCASLLAADFVRWQPEFSLWMPVVTARVRPAIFSEESKKLPFEEPKLETRIEASPTPVFQRVPLDPWRTLLYRQPYFSAQMSAAAPKQYLEIENFKGSPMESIAIEGPALRETDFMMSRSPTDWVILSAVALSPEAREAILQSANHLTLLPGEYRARIVWR